jgi:signal transduction histidine kinase
MHSLYEADTAVRQEEALTDGSNLYGKILPIRTWLDELAKRHDLEVELPLVNRELQTRYASQKRILYLMRILMGGFLLLAVIATFMYRSRQQRLLFMTRERITADLHDVLGGNISAIGLLGELADGELSNPSELSGYHKRIIHLATRTRKSLKYITNMLSQPGLYENLPAEMKRIATGLTEGLEHDLKITGEHFISRIDQRKRVDIFLFFKECLVNIIRHSRATHVVTLLDINSNELTLEVADNGIGLPGADLLPVPSSLRRRARILGGKVTATRAPGGGTLIRLSYKWNRTLLEKLLHLPFTLRS